MSFSGEVSNCDVKAAAVQIKLSRLPSLNFSN